MNKGILLITLFALGIGIVANAATKQEIDLFNAVQRESNIALAIAEKAKQEKPGEQKQRWTQTASQLLQKASDNILEASDKIKDKELTFKLSDLLNQVDDAKMQFSSVSFF